MGDIPGAPGSSPARKEKAAPECDAPANAHKGWYSRGYLPHFDSPEVIQHVTFHLADSLPAAVLARMEEELRAMPPKHRDAERRKKIETWIDVGHGSCVLQAPSARRGVVEVLHRPASVALAAGTEG